MNTILEKRNSVLFDTLVPDKGKAGTVEGELLRAANKLHYRYYNDGDCFYLGYGIETVGGVYVFLLEMAKKLNIKELEELLLQLDEERPVEEEYDEKEDSYGEALDKVVEIVLGYIESKNGNYTPSDRDMLDGEYGYKAKEMFGDYE